MARRVKKQPCFVREIGQQEAHLQILFFFNQWNLPFAYGKHEQTSWQSHTMFRKPLEDFVGHPLSETVVKKSSTEPRQIIQNAIQDFLDGKELVGDEIFSGLDLFYSRLKLFSIGVHELRHLVPSSAPVAYFFLAMKKK